MVLESFPRLGLGTWALGGPFFAGDTALGWGEVPEAQALATIDAVMTRPPEGPARDR